MGREAEEFEMLVGEQRCLEAACMKFAFEACKYFRWYTIATQTSEKGGERGTDNSELSFGQQFPRCRLNPLVTERERERPFSFLNMFGKPAT